ncbi:hypothetical protein F4803DRAFT_570026 [Xylaria telfairii]|nr:hypothetical protein F4803DRAFT_570026 [Xylaria telfairii]
MNEDIDENPVYLRNISRRAPFWVVNERKDIIRTYDILTQYFNRDEENRFHMDSVVGGGMFGLTWKLRYVASPTPSSPAPSSQHIVLKTDRIYSLYDDVSGVENEEKEDEDEDEEEFDRGQSLMPNEIKWLRVLRWSKHIVKEVTFTKDPLTRQFPGIRSHNMDIDNWIYLEWLENGTVKKFVDRATELGIQFPNRLLWRFFLCLVRMCIAMGWPAEEPDEEDPQPVTEVARGRPKGGLIHGDMHDQNIMFGNFIPNDPDMEHEITPILKLIDLGGMRMVDDNRAAMRGAVHENLFDIGIIMVQFVTLSSDTARGIYPSESLATKFKLSPNSDELMTNANVILPTENFNPYPNLESALRGLICSCLATNPENRPSVSGLANVVTTCIRNRDAQFYADRGFEGESDDDIRSILQQLIFDPA